MAADQALEFEVVTAKGEFVTANADINPDLFWALRGGGPATFAIVTSLTVKTFPEVPSAMVILNINSTHTTNTALWWQAVTLFHSLSNHYVDNDLFVYYELTPGTLHIQPFVGPNMNSAKLAQILKPLYDGLTKLGIRYTAVAKEYPTFFQLYMDVFESEPAGSNQLTELLQQRRYRHEQRCHNRLLQADPQSTGAWFRGHHWSYCWPWECSSGVR